MTTSDLVKRAAAHVMRVFIGWASMFNWLDEDLSD